MNSFLGPNSLSGSNSLSGTSGYLGDSSLSGISDTLLKPLSGTLNPIIRNLFDSNIVHRDGRDYWMGRNNPSDFTAGAGSHATRDIGMGRYEILDAQGNPLATGYQSPRSAIEQIIRDQELSRIYGVEEQLPAILGGGTRTRFQHPLLGNWSGGEDGLGSGTFNLQNFQDRASAETALTNFLGRAPAYGGVLGDWEALGQVLNHTNRTQPGNVFNRRIPSPYPSSMGSEGQFPANGASERITGANSLYGSTPIFRGDNFLGYVTDLGPGHTGDYYSKEYRHTYRPTGVSRSHSGEGSTWHNSVWRDINADAWRNAGVSGFNGDNIFIPASVDTSKLPGWTNRDSYDYESHDKGFLGGFGGLLGSILQFTPLAPLGTALSVMSSLSSGNPLGAVTSLLGASGALGGLGNYVSKTTGLPSWAANAAVQGGLGGIGSALSGGNFGRGFLGSALGSVAGSTIGSGLGGLGAPNWVSSLGSSMGNQLVRQRVMGNSINPRGLAINAVLGGLNQMVRNSYAR